MLYAPGRTLSKSEDTRVYRTLVSGRGPGSSELGHATLQLALNNREWRFSRRARSHLGTFHLVSVRLAKRVLDVILV